MKVNSGTIKLSSFSFQGFFSIGTNYHGPSFFLHSIINSINIFFLNVHIQNRAKVNDIVLIYIKKTESNSKMLP